MITDYILYIFKKSEKHLILYKEVYDYTVYGFDLQLYLFFGTRNYLCICVSIISLIWNYNDIVLPEIDGILKTDLHDIYKI